MKQEDRTPVLVKNPYRDVVINVEPLFYLLYMYHHEEGFEKSDLAIKLVGLCEESEWVTSDERKSILLFLYEIRDLFSVIKECQITLPKMKGGSA